MPPENGWRPDAILRLAAGVLVCMYAGSILGGVFQYSPSAGRSPAWVVYTSAAASLIFLGATVVLIYRRWQLEKAMKQLAITMLLFYIGMGLGAWTVKLAGPVKAGPGQVGISALAFHGAALLLSLRFLKEHGLTPSQGFGLGRRRSRAILFGLCATCIFMPVGWGLQHLSTLVLQLLEPIGIKPVEQETVQILRATTAYTDYIKLGLVTIVLAPLAEEILFRGILYRWAVQTGFRTAALWGTAALFAVVHFNLATLLPLLVLAVVLAKLYERTENLIAPIAAHSLFNALNFSLLFLAKHPGP